jgi:hypothetical protein
MVFSCEPPSIGPIIALYPLDVVADFTFACVGACFA